MWFKTWWSLFIHQQFRMYFKSFDIIWTAWKLYCVWRQAWLDAPRLPGHIAPPGPQCAHLCHGTLRSFVSEARISLDSPGEELRHRWRWPDDHPTPLGWRHPENQKLRHLSKYKKGQSPRMDIRPKSVKRFTFTSLFNLYCIKVKSGW